MVVVETTPKEGTAGTSSRTVTEAGEEDTTTVTIGETSRATGAATGAARGTAAGITTEVVTMATIRDRTRKASKGTLAYAGIARSYGN